MADGSYREFSHSYQGWDDEPVEVKIRLRKPSAQELNRCVAGVRKDMLRSFQTLLADIIHPEDKDALAARLGEDVGLAATLGNEILERCGFGQLGK